LLESSVLRIVGSKMVEFAGGWRRLHNEELRNMYTSSDITMVMKSGMRWARHVARIGKMRIAYTTFVRKL
jgi:hypothetical protein